MIGNDSDWEVSDLVTNCQYYAVTINHLESLLATEKTGRTSEQARKSSLMRNYASLHQCRASLVSVAESRWGAFPETDRDEIRKEIDDILVSPRAWTTRSGVILATERLLSPIPAEEGDRIQALDQLVSALEGTEDPFWYGDVLQRFTDQERNWYLGPERVRTLESAAYRIASHLLEPGAGIPDLRGFVTSRFIVALALS